MRVGIAYSEAGDLALLSIEVPDGVTVRDAIDHSGILRLFPHIDLAAQKVGVYGKVVKLDALLRPGDRVEIYRPIIADPLTIPRRDIQDEQ